MSTRTHRYRHAFAIWLATMSLALVSLAGGSAAAAQGEDVTAVCIEAFEAAPHTEWLTDAEIEEINQLEQDPSEPPVPEIVGYPDPATGSCATENGNLKDYDPDVYTPVCVPSGPEGDGPLVVQWVYTIYAVPEAGVILADPETGACPGDDGAASTGDEETSDDGTGNTSTSDEDTSGGDDDAASGDVSTLPETGTGAMAADASHQPGALGLLLAAVVLCGAGCLTRRVRAG